MNQPSNLRKDLLARRQAFVADIEQAEVFHQGFQENIAAFLNSKKYEHLKSIAFYWPIHGEPDIQTPLLEWLKYKPGRSIALPVTQKDRALDFYEWNQATQMSAGLYGIMEPQNTKQIIPELIFTPCLGWQIQHGKLWRLGYGGGYYDRTMAHFHSKNIRPILVGLGYSQLTLSPSEWQVQSHDIPLDALVTEIEILTSTQNG
jgi:5,10-methenyltetrahydrofolate synthetase